LKPFTLIGATTREGLISGPMRSRFGHALHFNFYDEESLMEIVIRSAELLEVSLDHEAALAIACRSRGTPRIANRLLKRVRDYAQVKGTGHIDLPTAEAAFNFLHVDELGLDELDRRYLKVLIDRYHGGPAGVEALAATLSEEADTLIDIIEPYLLKAGLIIRTKRGRVATENAFEHLGVPYTGETQEKLF
jgi:Holliday junction DNA helicase RuvB